MDQQSQRGRRNFNNNGGGGNGRFQYNNHYHHHHSRGGGGREFHSTQQRGGGGSTDINNNNSSFMNQHGYRPNIQTWRNLVRRQMELVNDKTRLSKETEAPEKKKGDGIKKKENNLGNKLEKCVSKPQLLDADDTPLNSQDGGPIEIVVSTEEAVSTSSLDVPKNNVSKISESCEQLDTSADAERMERNRTFDQKERKLELDTQRFFREMEHYIQTVDRRGFDPRLAAFENELAMRDQQMIHIHQKMVNLEEKTRSANEELEYFRRIAHQCTLDLAQREQEFAVEKEILIAKVKSETLEQLVRMSRNATMWQDPFLASDPKLNLNKEHMNHHPLLSSASYHAWVSESNSPCLQPPPTLYGNGIISDLRDRYEDVKCAGYIEGNDKMEWIMTMIRKIVLYYESHNMRVCEEALENQYVSTLIWCPNDMSCPQKSDQTSFALAYGTTQLEATGGALQQAYNFIMEQEKKTSAESETESISETSSSALPKSEDSSLSNETNEMGSSTTTDNNSRGEEILEEQTDGVQTEQTDGVQTEQIFTE